MYISIGLGLIANTKQRQRLVGYRLQRYDIAHLGLAINSNIITYYHQTKV